MSYLEKLKDLELINKLGIYRLIINDKIYVGSAINLPNRLRSHYNGLINNRHRNVHLQRAFNKYGIIDFEVIEIISDSADLITREQYYINTLMPYYNISPTAGSQLGFRHSIISKEKISMAQVGRVISAETRTRMSESKVGWSPTAEQRVNYSLSKMGDKNPFYKCGKNHPQYGTHRSAETLKKLSGDNNAMSKSGVLYDVKKDLNHIFFCLKPLCIKLKLNYRGVLSAQRNSRFYKDRYYIDFVEIPKRNTINP